jgi:carbonic anhydrase
MLEFNKKFVESEQYKSYSITKHPKKKIAVLACMDTRLTELLPAALNFKNGDVKLIKNAGAIVEHPFGGVMRSLLISIYELGVEKVLVIAHYDCGVQGLEAPKIINKMTERGINKENIDFINRCGVNVNDWLRGFDCVENSVLKTVDIIKNHPLMPEDVEVYGFIMDPETGKLDKINEPF